MLRREIQPRPVLWHNFRFYEPWTMNDCFFSDSDAAMPRQTQADNDASGSPQRVAGRPPLLSVLETVLHLPMVGTWRSERLWGGPYGSAIPRQIQADNDASGSPQRVAGRPKLLSVLATVLHLPMVGTWQSERLWDSPYGIAVRRWEQSADGRLRGSTERKKTRPLAVCVGAVPTGGPPDRECTHYA